MKEKQIKAERPKIHFAPAQNWMNDPNGTVFDGETFHLFYQYNPEGSDWGNIQWAYATSQNLIDWKRKGVKLSPEYQNGEQFCFSGCAVKVPDGFKLYYSSIGFEEDAARYHAKQLICDADSRFSEIKRNGCGIFAQVHPFPVTDWRDPFVFSWGGAYYMVLAGVSDRGHIFLYRADDCELNHWNYEGILFTIDDEREIPECPNVAMFGNKMVLLYSLAGANVVKYAAGEFDGKTLSVSEEGCVDYGVNCFYATNLAVGREGETVLFGWEREGLIGAPSVDGTYSGCLAIPRIMRLNGYVPEFHFTENVSKLYDTPLPVTTEEGKFICKANEERAHIVFRAEQNAKVKLLANGQEGVLLEFGENSLRIVRHSLTERAAEHVLEMKADKQNFVEVICDGTIVEMLVNNRAVSFRFYRAESVETLFAQLEGAVTDVRIERMKIPDIADE